jgi:hypothetical protein
MVAGNSGVATIAVAARNGAVELQFADSTEATWNV